jgi:acyl-CoA hydrolase
VWPTHAGPRAAHLAHPDAVGPASVPGRGPLVGDGDHPGELRSRSAGWNPVALRVAGIGGSGAVVSSSGEVTLRFLAAPTDAGRAGGVGGGKVLEWIDKAAYAAAANWAGTYCVTVYVGDVRFSRPIPVGDIVEAHAQLAHTGRSSMHIVVTVSSGDPKDRVMTPATSCRVVFVAVDGNGKTTAVPPWRPTTAEQRAMEETAAYQAGVRSAIEESMAEQSYPDAGTAPRPVLRFLAAPTDVNWGGKVHGGTAMRWIDDAAFVCASGWAKNAVTTVYVGGFRFYRPLLIGHVVEVEARLLHTGRTSMHVSVHVRSGDPQTDERALTTHGLLILVALDAEGRPVPVRTWEPVNDEDKALEQHARHLVELRSRMHDRT